MKYYDQYDLAELDEALTYDDINLIPGYSNIQSRSVLDVSTRLVGDVYLDVPVIPANMDTISGVRMCVEALKNGSIGFLHRFESIEAMEEDMIFFYREEDTQRLGVSVGVGDGGLSRASRAIDIFNDYSKSDDRLVILVDVAHGYHLNVINAVKNIRAIIDMKGASDRVFLIAGNVATSYGAGALIEAGAQGIKVGVGNGSLCETRIRTAAGVPQVSALAEVYSEITSSDWSDHRTTIIADGGIKYPGDVVKALWLGASAGMSGYLFAGTDETPGSVMKKGLFPNEKEVKIYRGSASHASKIDRGESRNVEGNIKEIPAKGPVKYVFDQVKDGIQSGFSYAGVESTIDLQMAGRVCRITSSGIIEARPNLLER